ncbi:MAG: hypothetical protein F9K16_12885 [Thermoanaerobaculia bacterium]|nr:MAG: hypothetical protein F9K16_12885 [Thermoanaerobaculia bacterium]MBZ0102586.1 hypothetical protein [Thermoanaerobaculia bacterium]
MQKVRLTVSAITGRPFDGEAQATVEIDRAPQRAHVRVRPYRSRRVVEIPLQELVQIVLERDAKARAREAVRDRQAARAGWGRG